jgi:16S rRNA (guanine1207-N2)-methyltransferase
MTNIDFETPFGCYQLQRLPRRSRELLRAWDAADEYLLNTLAEEGLLAQPKRTLILNDSFGALAVALHEQQLWSQSDSALAHDAVRSNYADNQLSTDKLVFLSSLEVPDLIPELVLIKIPKTLALLEYQLHLLRPLLEEDVPVLVAGMVKSMSGNIWKLLERILGGTRTSLARKKAKLISVDFNGNMEVPPNPYPDRYILEDRGWEISNHANVFSRERLDIGTRFFLQHLPVPEPGARVIDLGCGNGLLALTTASKQPQAEILCVDESYMALASTRENFVRVLGDDHRASFLAATDLSDVEDGSIDLVLCNPPFHQQHVVGDFIALNMFRDSHRVLKPEGALWVIGNRHLGYHQKLAHIFRQVDLIASNRKFVILCGSR